MSLRSSNSIADDDYPGSRGFPFKLAIIGGGPSGCSVIVRAVRTGYIERLCGADKESQLSGVCIIDQCSLDRFGGGRLQDYSINSNTFAVKFASNVLDDKQESLPPELCTGSYFEKLKTSENCKLLYEYGNKQGSLQVVGGFLHDVGTSVVETLAQYPATSRCLTDTTLNSAERYVRDDGLTGWKLSISKAGEAPSFIYAKDVLFATGGRQETPILANNAHNCKVLGSDFVCTDEGIEDVRRRILKSIRTTGKHKVVIVGGSHSAFSAAWMCLHKLDLTTKEDATPSESEKSAAEADTDTNTNGTERPLEGSPSSPATLPKSPTNISPNEEQSDNTAPDPPLPAMSPSKAVVCKIKERDKIKQKPFNTRSGSISMRGVTGQNDVVVLHRSYIKVFYSTKKEADTDLYYDTGVINKSTGQIHPFGGLRGDSKLLWRDIKCGRENRVRLVALRSGIDVTQQSIGTKLFDEAAVIVWACGYKTNICPIYEADGTTPISLGYYRGQVEVDELARILTAKAQATVLPPPPYSIVPSVNSVKSIIRSIEQRSSFADMAANTPSSYEGKARGGSQDGNTDEECDSHSEKGSRDAYTAQTTIFKSSSQDSSVCDTLKSRAREGSNDGLTTGVFDTNGPAVSRTPEQCVTTAIKHPPSPTSTRPANAAAPTPAYTPVGGLLGSGMGYGLKATLDNGEADGSSGRADGVAVYLKHGATLVLAHVLGPSVYGDGINSWEDRTVAMRKLALQSHIKSRETSKIDIVVESDAEGLDNAYRQRTVTQTIHESSAKSPIVNICPPSPLSLKSPRRDRRRSTSCFRRMSSPSPSAGSSKSASRSDLDLVSLSKLSSSRAIPSSNSAPSTARNSLSLPDTQPPLSSSAAANDSIPARTVSPTSLFQRVTALTDQQALGVTRLSAPRSIPVPTSKTPAPVAVFLDNQTIQASVSRLSGSIPVPTAKTPPPITVFLDNHTIQASVSRLSACPVRSVAINESAQPNSEVNPKKSSTAKGVSASRDSSRNVRKEKESSSGKEKKIFKLPAPSASPKIVERQSGDIPITPTRSLPHRRAILQSEALSKDTFSAPSDSNPSIDSISEPTFEAKSSGQTSDKSENDMVRASLRRSISVTSTSSRAVRKMVPVPMPLKSVMLELDLSDREGSKILRIGPSVPLLSAAATDQSTISRSGAVTDKVRHKGADRVRTKIESKGTIMSASAPGDFLDSIESSDRMCLTNLRPFDKAKNITSSTKISVNITSLKTKFIQSH